MVRYRPISPAAAWRDPVMAEVEIPCRFAEIYLLTSTFANVIGCFQIVDSIAAVEIGMSLDEFRSVVNKLVDHGIIVRYQDYILVTRWFKHHGWESVLKGNVAPRAVKEAAALPEELRSLWVSATINAGAPSEFVLKIVPLASPTQGASKGDAHSTINKTLTSTTTEPDAGTESQLQLSSCIEPHRGYLERETAHLGLELAQKVADELAGAITAAKSGKRPEIGSIEGWVSAVIKSAGAGGFRQEFGLAILKEREASLSNQNKIANEEAAKLHSQQQLDQRVQFAEQSLQCFSTESLAALVARFKYTNVISSAKKVAADALLQRKVLRGPSCIAALEVIEEFAKQGAH